MMSRKQYQAIAHALGKTVLRQGLNTKKIDQLSCPTFGEAVVIHEFVSDFITILINEGASNLDRDKFVTHIIRMVSQNSPMVGKELDELFFPGQLEQEAVDG